MDVTFGSDRSKLSVPRSFVVLMNPASGHDDADDTRATIERVLGEAGAAHEIVVLDRSLPLAAQTQAAVQRARAGGAVVVAAGGDGTVNAIAQQVLGSGCTFGLVPQGTFNYFARSHGIPQEAEPAVRLLLAGRPQPVQAGLVNDKLFLVNASLGLYPELLEDREQFKQRFGRSRLVALGAAIATLAGRHPTLRLSVEQGGEQRLLRTPTLFVGNNALQMAQLGLPEAQAIEAGCLAAVVVRPVGRLEMLRLMLAGALGRLAEADNVQRFAFRRITVQPWRLRRGRVKVATDGETTWLAPPLVFRTAPEPLLLIRPEP
jgi:diacylglycerol kinase family enzyme